MTYERFEFPNLFYNEGTVEQLAQRLAATAIAYEVQRLEDRDRCSGWAGLNRPLALEAAGHLRRIAAELHQRGAVGLEARVAEELARMRGFPCEKCGHRHEGTRYQLRCFFCSCGERPLDGGTR